MMYEVWQWTTLGWVLIAQCRFESHARMLLREAAAVNGEISNFRIETKYGRPKRSRVVDNRVS